MSELSSILEIISRSSGIHICIHDVSGVLSFDKLKINYENQTHFTPYCNAVKTTPCGYRLCTKCKNLANQKAINTQKPFCGYCPFGLFEAVYPVVADKNVHCIVYAGNAVPNIDIYKKKLAKTMKITKLKKEKILPLINTCENTVSENEVLKTADVVANYTKLLITDNRYQHNLKRNSFGWAVEGICRHIENNYREKLTLKNLAKLYFMNEKYLGRLFKTQTGKSFNEYLNETRLEKAVELLMTTDKTILEIALDCGYQSVNYFNRLCLEQYNMTPTKLRMNYSKDSTLPRS